MTDRPRLFRSIPFWVLLVGSLASIGYGGWLVLDKISTMTATLADGSATGVEVYAGQSWIVVGGAFIGAGLIGLVAVLALAALRSFAPAATPVALADEQAPASDVPASEPGIESLGYGTELGYTAPVATHEADPEPAPATASEQDAAAEQQDPAAEGSVEGAGPR